MKTAADYPKLNLPSCRLRVSERAEGLCVWDVHRGRWLVLTPEEWVRRHVLSFLASSPGVVPAAIAQEHPVSVNGTTQRADLVLFGPDGGPALLVECKAPGVVIDRGVLDQAFRYNVVLRAPRVMLTNGLDHFLYLVAADGTGYTPLRGFPQSWW